MNEKLSIFEFYSRITPSAERDGVNFTTRNFFLIEENRILKTKKNIKAIIKYEMKSNFSLWSPILSTFLKYGSMISLLQLYLFYFSNFVFCSTMTNLNCLFVAHSIRVKFILKTLIKTSSQTQTSPMNDLSLSFSKWKLQNGKIRKKKISKLSFHFITTCAILSSIKCFLYLLWMWKTAYWKKTEKRY